MAKYTTTFTADASTLICKVIRRHDANDWHANFFINGSTFGSGTMVIQYSPDNGTTKITGKDFNGTTMSATANSVFTSQPLGGDGSNSEYISVYGTLTGSTNPSITVTAFDNR